jgi:hypothetical protein
MKLLLTQALPVTERTREAFGPNVGRLLTPRHFPSALETVERGIPIAADNDAFSEFNETRYLAMLEALAPVAERLRFVTAPDVVGEARPTLERFAVWGPELRRRGFAAGLVGQDGMTPATVPWGSFDAFFVGGSTEWKLGAEARELCQIARELGLWVHVGRVNSLKRCRLAEDMGADSVDGSGWVKFKREMLPRWSRFEAGRQAVAA